MGYRSEVKGLIYGSEQEMQVFKESCFDLYNQIFEDFGDSVTIEKNKKYSFICLNLSYSKWYDDYDEVKHWKQLYDLAQQAELNTEFARVGEEWGDIEVDNSGDSCEYYLEITQKVDSYIHRFND